MYSNLKPKKEKSSFCTKLENRRAEGLAWGIGTNGLLEDVEKCCGKVNIV
jgi:hypothetical protein